MASGVVGILVATILFGSIGLFGFFFVGRNHKERGLIQVMIVTTCLCLYVFWAGVYLAQLNPLTFPELDPEEIFLHDK